MTGSASGTGPGAVTYTVVPNPFPTPRTGSISVAGNIVHLMQSGTNPSSGFADVPASHPFVHHIALMRTNAVTSGCTPTTYCPDGTTTRGQMAVFIIRALMGGDDFPFPATPYSTDVPATHQFFKWIQKMRELGITSGCTLTTYCPDDAVTRGQMAVFVIRGLAGNAFSYNETPYFIDAPVTHPFFRYIQKMKEWGITAGCSATEYCPDSNTTRGQMAVFIMRGFFSAR